MEINGDKKVFGGSFSYSVFKDANLQTISGDFANAQTGIVNPPSGNNKDYQQAVINKTTGAVVSNSTGVSDTNYGKLIALNNNQLVAASDTSLKLSNILAPKDAQAGLSHSKIFQESIQT